MNKKYFLFIICCFLFTVSNAQQPIGVIKYLCSTEIRKGSLHEGVNSLYFTPNKSLYIHDEWPKENKYITSGRAVAFIKGDTEGMSVFRNLQTDSMYWKTGYSAVKRTYILKDTLPEINWTVISQQTKTMSGLHCIKAEGEFGSRHYTVWYTPDIPVPIGPYKLGGLPGMILQAETDDGRVKYIFHSYEPEYEGDVKVDVPSDGILLTYEEFRDIRIRSLESVEAATSATHNDPPANYEIEKNKWNIYSTYKRKRAAKKN